MACAGMRKGCSPGGPASALLGPVWLHAILGCPSCSWRVRGQPVLRGRQASAPRAPPACSKKKKREGMSDSEAKAVVEALLAQMEVAVEEDHKAFEEGEGRGQGE